MASKNVKIDLDEEMQGKTRCTDCGRILSNANFYVSNSRINTHTKRISLCKDCLTRLYISYLEDTQDIKLSMYKICRILDYYYTDQLYESSYTEAGGWNKDCTLVQNGLEIWKKYIKTINSLTNYKGYSFEHGEVIDNLGEQTDVNEENNKIAIQEFSEDDIQKQIRTKKNREDIINIVGYDPFENDLEIDKPKLYAKLVNMLPEDSQDNDMKIGALISIIKSQNQEDRINDLITSLSSDPKTLKSEIGTIKSLTDTKEKLNKSALSLAKDNKISDLYSGNKTAGGNTLTGMLKKIREIDLENSQVNLFDIRTSDGMLQTARLSTKAMIENLNFGDDALLDMVKFQREKMDFYDTEYCKLFEENRKLRVLCSLNDIDYAQEIIETEYKDVLEFDKDKYEEEYIQLDNKIKEVKPITTMDYIEEVIRDKEEIEKEKILKSITK